MLRPFRRYLRPLTFPFKHYKQPAARLGVVELEDRNLLSVTSSLSGGVLTVQLSAANDSASLSRLGNVVTVAGNSYAAASIASVSVVGSAADDQSLAVSSNLTLPGTFTVAGVENVTFSGGLTLGARSTAVSHALGVAGAHTITVGAGATLFTRATAGLDPLADASFANSGGVSFTAKTIDVKPGARIAAHADNGFQAGDVTLTATDARTDTYMVPLFNSKQAVVSLTVGDNAIIRGRNVTLAADASAKRYTLYDLGTLATGPAALPSKTVTTGLVFAPGLDDGSQGPTIVRSAGNWTGEGFKKETTIAVTGTPDGKNDGTYDVESVSADGKTLQLVGSNAVRGQTVPTGTGVKIRQVKTDLAAADVPFVAVDENGNPVAAQQKQSDFTANAQPPVGWNPVANVIEGLPMPVQVSLTQVYAKTTVGNGVQLAGTSNVTVSSKAVGTSRMSVPSLVFGVTWTESDVQAITTVGDATIAAGGTFAATAELTNHFKSASTVLGGSVQNPTNGDPVKLPGPSVSIGVARGNSVATAETSAGTVIVAGGVTIDATMENKFANETSATTSNGGSVGAAIGVTVGVHNAAATATLRGTVTAGGDVSVKTKADNAAVEHRAEASVDNEDAQPGSGMLGAFTAITKFLSTAKDKQDDKSKNGQSQEEEGGSKASSLSIAGAVAIAFSDLSSRASVGDDAVVRINGGGLVVDAFAGNAAQSSAVGAAKANSKFAVGGAFVYADYETDARAWVGANAVLNADKAIAVKANAVEAGGFPTSFGDFVGGVLGLRDTGLPWVSSGETKSFSDAVGKSGDFADATKDLIERGQAVAEGDWSFLLQEFGSSFVSASAQPGEVKDKDGNTGSKSNAASGSFDMVFTKTHATAWVGEGVTINQDTPDADADQSVTVEAATETKALFFGGLSGQKNPFGYGTVANGGAVGGVYAHHDYDVLAKAFVADGVRIQAAGDLVVNAKNDLIVGVWDFAGSSGKNFAVQGTFTVTPVDSVTLAYVENSAVVEVGKGLEVTAATDNLFVTFTGAIAKSDKVGVGAGLGYVDADTTTKAFVGNLTTTAKYADKGTLTVGGDTTVAAEADTLGVTVAISAALSLNPKPAPPSPPAPPVDPDDALDGESLRLLFGDTDDAEPTNTKATEAGDQKAGAQKVTGFGLSASLGLNLIDGVTFAGIDGTTLTSPGTVTVDAKSNELFIVATGAASLNLNTGADSSTAIAGALAWNDLDRTVTASINNAVVTADDVTVAAKAKNLLVSFTAGAAVTSPAQKAKTSLGLAGSANLNDLDTTVSATVTGTTTITSAGSVSVTADHTMTVVSIAGAVGVSQRAGIGAAFDLGFYTTTVEAKVGDGVQVTAADDVTVAAKNDAFLLSIGASIGVATEKFGLAGSASWINDTTTVSATVGNNAKVTAGGDMRVTATEDLFAFGLAGAAGIGKSSGFGAGIAGFNLTRTVNASIGNNATISVGGSTKAGDHGLFVTATTDDDLFLFGAGGAVAANQAGVAGSLALLIDNTTTNASIGTATTVTQPAGLGAHTMSVFVTADHDSDVLVVAGALAVGKSAGVGFGVVVMPVTHVVTASIASSAAVSANNDVRIQANHSFDETAVAAALGAAGSGVGVAGAGVIQPLAFTTAATVGSAAVLSANGNIVVTADGAFDSLGVAGTGALGIGGSGVGISNVTTIRDETVKAEVGNFASLTARGNKGTFAAADDSTSLKNERGVIVTATLDDDVTVIAAGAAGGTSGAGVAGSASVTVQTTNVLARLGNGVTVNPNAADRSAANAAQDVYLYAEHLADFTGAGGGGGFGSQGGVGVGVDVGTITRTTRAVIDDSANVYARGDVLARAVAGGDWISVAASLGGGGTAGIAGSASIQVHAITTQARVGTGATVYAVGNVVVSAKDELQIDGIAGQISIGGTAGVGGSIPVVVVTKTTDASIGDNATVDALGNTTAFQAHVTPPSVAFTDALFFATTAVDVSANSVNLGRTHGFQTGDSVTYWANGTPIGGLSNGGTYYAIAVNGTTIKLATTAENAAAGTAIDLTSAGSSAQQSITAYGEVAAPAVNNSSATDDVLKKQRTLTFGTTGVRGVVVSAVSIDDYATYGVSGGGGGTVGVQIVASVSVPSITTTATVGNGAQVNQNDTVANAGQSVTVAAIADYDRLGIGGSLAIGGAAGIAPLADVLVSSHVTTASIGSTAKVGAERDVVVAADQGVDVKAFVIGVAGAGTAAVAGSVGVIVLDTVTHAVIGSGATVAANGNVVVSAADRTDGVIVIGSAALGLGGAGVGASVNVSSIEKDTLARIADNATVTGLAKSGWVTAYTGDGLTTASVQGVIVQAVSDEDILNVVVAGGAGLYAGVAGAVNVNVLTANTTAQVGSGVTVNAAGTAGANQSVVVAAVDKLDLDVVGGALGLGAAGVAGSVDVGIVRSNTSAAVGSNTTVNAKKDIAVGSAAVRDVDSTIIGASGGLGALAASVGVYSLYATVDQASKDSLNGSGNSNGAAFADSAGNTSVISNGLGGYKQNSQSQGGQQLASVGNSAKGTVASRSPTNLATSALAATPTPSGTSATVGSGAKLTAGGNVSVLTSDNVQIDVLTGTAAGGAAGIGASVTYASVGGQSLASVGDNATLSGGIVTVSAGYAGDADAKAYGGAAGGFVGVGAQVAILNDTHNETARVGNNATVTATNSFSVATTSTRALNTANAGGAVGGLFAGGASYSQIDSRGSASATLGSGGTVTAGTGGVNVTANSTVATDANAVGVAAGAVAIAVTLAEVKVAGGANANIGSGTNVTAAGDVAVKAAYTSTTDLDAVGVTAGLGSVGAMDVKFTDTSSTTAALANVGTFNVAGNLTVLASADNTVTLDAVGTSVGGVAGNGAGVTVSATPTVAASASSTGVITVGNSITVVGRAGGEFDADTTGVSVGGIAVGVSIINVNWSPNVAATVGGGTTMAAGENLTVRSLINYDAAGNAQTGKTVDVGVVAVAGGLVGGSASVVSVTNNTTSATTIGSGAALTATNTLRIGSDQRTRTDVTLTGVNVGFVAGGAVFGDARVNASSTVTLPDSTAGGATRLAGGNGVAVRAGIDHGGRANVRGGAGGLFGAAAGARFNYYLSGPNTGDDGDAVPVTVSVGKNTVISSTGLTDLGTFVGINYESDSFLAGIGGLGSAVDSDLSTVSSVASNVLIGENAKIGTRNLRISTDQNVRSDTDTDAQAYGVFGSSTSTDSTSRYYATNNVNVGTGAVIVATGAATLENANGNVYVRADSYARGVSFIASVNADSYGTRRMNNSVTVASGTEIITPRLAVQSLRPQGRMDVTADSTNASAAGFFISIWNAITGGDVGRTPHPDGNVGGDTVDLNAAITLGSPRNVELTVDATGGITRQNWPTAVITPTQILVDDIYTAQPERLDVRAPNGQTKGTSTVTYGPMETVTIQNASKRDLVLRNIDTFSNGVNIPVYNHEGANRTWTYTENKSTVTNGEATQVHIRNTAAGTGSDVQLMGRLDVIAGTVNITANGGDVYSLSANGYVNSRAVNLNATAGALGTTANPLFLRTPQQANTALPVGIQSAHGETGGNLNVSVTSPSKTDFTYRVQNVTSNTGTMTIVANEGAAVTRGATTEVQLAGGTAYQGTVLGPLAFDPANPAQFNAAADTITLNYAHGLTTGDRVSYQPLGATPVGGIVPWVEREVKVVNDRTIQFSTNFDTDDVSTAKDTVSFAAPHGIQTGEAVVYDANGTTAVGGLTDAKSYYAWTYDANTVQVYDSAANANASSVSFRPNTVQHIPNPGYDKDAKSGLATLKFLDVIAVSDAYTFTTGQKLLYWTHDTNALRQWTGGNTQKYWTNTLTFESGKTDPNDTGYTSTAPNSSANFVSLPSLSYFYAVPVPNPENKEELKYLVALAESAADATDGDVMKLSTPENPSQESHYLRPTTGLVNLTSAPANKTQAFRADLTAPGLPGGLHIIDTGGVYVQDGKGNVTRVNRDDVRSIRDVIAESLTTAAGTTTTVELGSITASNGDVHIEVGTSGNFATQAHVVNTISAAGTIEVEVDGGSLLNKATATNFVANLLDVTAWNDVGQATAAVSGKVQFFTALAGTSGTSGGVWFENTGKLSVRDVTAINDISVTVLDQAGDGDDLFIDANYTVTSTLGAVSLKAGDKLYVPADAKINAGTGVNLYMNYGNAEGTAGVLDLRGAFGAKVINIFGNENTVDTVLDDNDMNFEIGDTYLRRYVGKTLDTTFNLFNVAGDHFNLTAGGKDNTITVTDWTGTGVIDAGAGVNRIVAVNDVDFDLGDTTFSRSGHGDITFTGNTIGLARLTGGAGDNRFTVTRFTGHATLDGAGGVNAVVDVNDVNFTLDDTFLARSTPGAFDLANITTAVLTAGAKDNRFEISEWTGTAILDGGAGLNAVASVRDGDYALSDTALVRTVGGAAAGGFDLTNVTKSVLIGGESDNTFTVTGWTGQAKLSGTTGLDRVLTASDTDAFLIDDFLTRGDGGQFALDTIETAVLVGGAATNHFLVEGWTGAVAVDGGTGGDYLAVNANTDYALTGTSVRLGNGTVVDVHAVETVTLSGGAEDNIFTVEERPDFFTVLHGGGGDDAATVSAAGDFTLTASSLALGGLDRFHFEAVDRISLNGTTGDNTFLIDGWAGGLAVHGGDGRDTVRVTADTDFALVGGAINLGTGKTINLSGVETAELHGGDGDNRFDIGADWAGTVTVYGGGGIDVVSALVPHNVTLTDGLLTVQDGPTVGLVGVERAVLIGLPGRDHAFVLDDYTGEVSVVGSGGDFDRLVVTSAGSFDLQSGHLSLGTGAEIDFAGIAATVLIGAATAPNQFFVRDNTGAVSIIGGQTGQDEVTVVADADFVLDDSLIELGDGTTIHLDNLTKATLVGGAGDNTFDVSGWTGFATLDGAGGTDAVTSDNDTDFVLTSDTLQRADGAIFALAGIEAVNLFGGAEQNQFTVDEWHGRAHLDGRNGSDEYRVVLTGVGASSTAIADTGTDGTDTLTVFTPQGQNPLVTMHGVWLGDEQIDHTGVEEFTLN